MNKRLSTLRLGFDYLNGNLPATGTRLLNEALKRDGRLRKDLARLVLMEELLRELGREEVNNLPCRYCRLG